MSSASNAQDLLGRKGTAFLLWGLPILLLAGGFLWPEGRGIPWSVAFLWIGGSCLANAIRCRRAHCLVMGPLFLLLGLASVLKTAGLLSIPWAYVGRTAGIVLVLAFLPECLGKKYFGKGRAP